NVRAADSGAHDVDGGLARSGSRLRNVLHLGMPRSRDDESPHRRSPDDASVRLTRYFRSARADEEVEVRAPVRLQHVVDIEPLPAAPGRREAPYRRFVRRPPRQLLLRYLEIDPAATHIERDPVAGL